MASLALGIVGSFFGPIGGMIGSAIGSMIDNKLFPNKQQGPRLTDLTVTVSTYGRPIARLWGNEVRVSGNVIWSTGLIETKHTRSVGKGGPSTQVTEYTYRASIAVLLADRAGMIPILGVKKIWANAKLIYDADETDESDPDAEPQGFLDLVSPLSYYIKSQATHAVFDRITVYPGDFLQEPDPTIESYEGAGNVPGYRGSAYIVIKDLQLADYGNRIPNLEFLVVADDGVAAAKIFCDVADMCGIDHNTIGTGLAFDTVRGYAIGVQASGLGACQPIAVAVDVDCGDVAGGLRFTKRTTAPRAVIPLRQLGGHVAGEARPEAITWTRNQETSLPRESAVTFNDPERDWQANTATARRAAGSADSNLSTELAITLDADGAQRIADRLLWEAWQGRQIAQARTDDRWSLIEAGQKYIFETPAGLEPLRVTRRTRGANGLIDMDLRRDRGEVYRSNQAGTSGTVPTNSLELPGPTEIIFLDIPILLDADDNPGFYFAIVGNGDGWRGADVLRALSISSDFEEVDPVGVSSTVGDVTGTLPDGDTPDPASPSVEYDDVTVLTVVLRSDEMTLGSVDDAALAAGANACFVGDPDDTTQGEILQFGTATLVDTATYELTHLIRGRKGTEFATSLHGLGEIFVLLEQGVTQRANYGVTDLNLERVYKAVSLLTLEADTDAVYFTNTGIGLRPYSPIELAVSGDTGDDHILTWTRRSRLESGELAEASELYTVRIMNSLGTIIKREVQVTEPQFVYTAAMQTTDFGGVVSDLRWRVAQVSATYGDGIFAELNGPIPVTG